MEITFGLVIILVASFIQGLSSFGLSIVSLPFLIRIFPLQEVVPLITFFAMLTNIMILITSGKKPEIKKFGLLILMGILFLPVGVFSLRYFNPSYLKLFLGVFITGFSLLLVLKKTFPIKHEKIGYSITGSLSGFLNGSLSMSGPPVVLFLSIQGTAKETFRASINLYFLILNVVTVLLFFSNGLLNRVVLGRILHLSPAMIIGVLAGILVCKKVNDEVFRRLVLIMMIFVGAWTTISTLANLIGNTLA